MQANHTSVNNAMQARLAQMERGTGGGAQRFDNGGGPSHGGARGYQIRTPNPEVWNLTILKNGEHGFLPWRKSFDM